MNHFFYLLCYLLPFTQIRMTNWLGSIQDYNICNRLGNHGLNLSITQRISLAIMDIKTVLTVDETSHSNGLKLFTVEIIFNGLQFLAFISFLFGIFVTYILLNTDRISYLIDITGGILILLSVLFTIILWKWGSKPTIKP